MALWLAELLFLSVLSGLFDALNLSETLYVILIINFLLLIILFLEQELHYHEFRLYHIIRILTLASFVLLIDYCMVLIIGERNVATDGFSLFCFLWLNFIGLLWCDEAWLIIEVDFLAVIDTELNYDDSIGLKLLDNTHHLIPYYASVVVPVEFHRSWHLVLLFLPDIYQDIFLLKAVLELSDSPHGYPDWILVAKLKLFTHIFILLGEYHAAEPLRQWLNLKTLHQTEGAFNLSYKSELITFLLLIQAVYLHICLSLVQIWVLRISDVVKLSSWMLWWLHEIVKFLLNGEIIAWLSWYDRRSIWAQSVTPLWDRVATNLYSIQATEPPLTGDIWNEHLSFLLANIGEWE